MILDAEMADLHVRRLIDLTQQLNDRLEQEIELVRRHKAADMATGMAHTAELANEYRRESAKLKSNPQVIANASLEMKQSLIKATERFDDILARHSEAVEAARKISEGLVRTIANEVAESRAMGTGYGSSGYAATGDGRAVALDRKA
ncbi:flagellar basal-body protein FlbY [uncultured Brevundimonas sp.]|uniref:flagellar basal-body protein FlbY n=1 Tax=uncultured Brevundimonas sp. TaxID=213418 RepID=UPI002613833B|nr:flagellar basal-body protein FlbY [uncultured Brevundimonas sp.]